MGNRDGARAKVEAITMNGRRFEGGSLEYRKVLNEYVLIFVVEIDDLTVQAKCQLPRHELLVTFNGGSDGDEGGRNFDVTAIIRFDSLRSFFNACCRIDCSDY